MITGDDIVRMIESHRYAFTTEAGLQAGIEAVLEGRGMDYERERRLDEEGRDRIDFYLPELRLGIEVKVGGSFAAVTRQLLRYASCEYVDVLMLVTSRSRHLAVPDRLGGKPVRVVFLAGGLA